MLFALADREKPASSLLSHFECHVPFALLAVNEPAEARISNDVSAAVNTIVEPAWFNKNIEMIEASDAEAEEMQALLKEFE